MSLWSPLFSHFRLLISSFSNSRPISEAILNLFNTTMYIIYLMGRFSAFLLFLCTLKIGQQVKIIDNGLAPPEIVHTPVSVKRVNLSFYIKRGVVTIINFYCLILQDAQRIVTNANLSALEPQFDRYHGTEICEKVPACVKGSDKPVDLALVIDASESVDQLFKEQIKFAIERIVGNINIHPEAVRLALITYSGNAFTHFKFNTRQFGNNSAVVAHLGTRPGVAKLAVVLTDGHSQRSPLDVATEMRAQGISTMAVSVTPRPYVDEAELLMIAGDQSRVFTPRNIQDTWIEWMRVTDRFLLLEPDSQLFLGSKRRNRSVTRIHSIQVSCNYTMIDTGIVMVSLIRSSDFEVEFLKHVGFGCEGLDLGPDAKPRVRGATDVSCTSNSVTFTVRTQRPMHGLMYAQHFHDDTRCVLVNDGSTREVSITFLEGTCGLSKTPTTGRDGYNFNVTVILQFHPLIITRADQGLDVNCFFPQSLTPQEIDRAVIKSVADTECSYRLHRYSPSQCVALDAKVGETLYHKWQCDSPPQYNYLVHDCYAKSEKSSVLILDSEGCEVDQHFLETPNYMRFQKKEDVYVFQVNLRSIDILIQTINCKLVLQEMSVFKFPAEGNLIFQCKISLCDMEAQRSPCTMQLVSQPSRSPPRCTKKRSVHAVREKRDTLTNPLTSPLIRLDRSTEVGDRTLFFRSRQNIAPTKQGFYMTMEVETRIYGLIMTQRNRASRRKSDPGTLSIRPAQDKMLVAADLPWGVQKVVPFAVIDYNLPTGVFAGQSILHDLFNLFERKLQTVFEEEPVVSCITFYYVRKLMFNYKHQDL
uniref:VWFA domain-containing protein n=1 Tax=Heterorhabditis bacteriophora TaxID=37862 RepID=A0A1I7XAS4_HETBA